LGDAVVTSRVSRKGLTTIPVYIRRELGIEEGDLLVWVLDRERGVAVVKVVKDPLKYLSGKYSDDGLVYEAVEDLAEEFIRGELGASD